LEAVSALDDYVSETEREEALGLAEGKADVEVEDVDARGRCGDS
jgi:hypothetical protein